MSNVKSENHQQSFLYQDFGLFVKIMPYNKKTFFVINESEPLALTKYVNLNFMYNYGNNI